MITSIKCANRNICKSGLLKNLFDFDLYGCALRCAKCIYPVLFSDSACTTAVVVSARTVLIPEII